VIIMKRIATLLFVLMAGMAGSPVHAQNQPAPAQAQAPAGGKDPKSCIDVGVNGYRAPSYDCLTEQMTPANTPSNATPPGLASGWVANAPSNQLGLANEAATRTRMGNTFGKSAQPQRPPAQNFSPLMNGR
jgi:hypothetical protein